MEDAIGMEIQKRKRKAEWIKKDALCKGCLKNQKRNGSKYCQSCSDKHKVSIDKTKK